MNEIDVAFTTCQENSETDQVEFHVFQMSIGRLENLPNELFLELFRYFSLDDLLAQFVGLNRRFDQLIRSFSYLTYLSEKEKKTSDVDRSFWPFVRRCVVRHPLLASCWANVSVTVRHLHLDYVTADFFLVDLPQLESLIVDRRVHPLYIDEIRRRIFSDGYPRLSRCSISRMSRAPGDAPWTGSTSLRVLRLNQIDGPIFLDVLLACPNLIELKIDLRATNLPAENSFRHFKLRRFRVNFLGDDERILENFLFALPQLEAFRVSREGSSEVIQRSIEFFSECFRRSLPVLCQFVFNVKVGRSTEREVLFQQWKNHFSRHEYFRLNVLLK